jgi:hypothetical protein
LNYLHDKDDEYDVIINKIHGSNINIKTRYDVVICPIRDVRDCAISTNLRFNKNKDKDCDYIKLCHDNIKLFENLSKIADYTFVYEKYNFEYVKDLVTFLNLNLTEDTINDIMMKLKLMHVSTEIVNNDNFNDETYKKTLYSQNHNTSNGLSKKYITEFNYELNKKIIDDKIIFNFLKKHNYE